MGGNLNLFLTSQALLEIGKAFSFPQAKLEPKRRGHFHLHSLRCTFETQGCYYEGQSSEASLNTKV